MDGRELLEIVVEARESGDLGPLVAAIPYTTWMGMSTALVEGELRCTMKYDDMLVGNAHLAALHGGTLGALLESTSVFALLLEAEPMVLPKTINITIDYLRSARAQDTHCRAIITRMGRTVANVRAEAWQDVDDEPDGRRLVAASHAHFLLSVPRSEAGATDE